MIVNEQGNKGIAAAVVAGLVVVGGIVGWSLSKKETPVVIETKNTMMGSPDSTGMMKTKYKNGNYEVMGDYTSPGGAEQLEVKLTLTDGVISDITVIPQATRPTSKIKQADFAEHYKVMVLGKNIDEVMLTKVSGSSLSPKGFNDAIEKIKSQARS